MFSWSKEYKNSHRFSQMISCSIIHFYASIFFCGMLTQLAPLGCTCRDYKVINDTTTHLLQRVTRCNWKLDNYRVSGPIDFLLSNCYISGQESTMACCIWSYRLWMECHSKPISIQWRLWLHVALSISTLQRVQEQDKKQHTAEKSRSPRRPFEVS